MSVLLQVNLLSKYDLNHIFLAGFGFIVKLQLLNLNRSMTLKNIFPFALAMSILNSPLYAANTHSGMEHSNMDHSTMEHSSMHSSQPNIIVMPTEAGNDAFGTIQEIMSILLRDPTTDWEKVNFEALRSHLSDMQDMTLNIEVISQKPIKNGLVSVIKPTTARSKVSLKRVFSAHPRMLAMESSFKMDVKYEDGIYTITTTTNKTSDVAKIRGLGYIGLMAYGNHHQSHHLSLAKGDNPHAVHHRKSMRIKPAALIKSYNGEMVRP